MIRLRRLDTAALLGGLTVCAIAHADYEVTVEAFRVAEPAPAQINAEADDAGRLAESVLLWDGASVAEGTAQLWQLDGADAESLRFRVGDDTAAREDVEGLSKLGIRWISAPQIRVPEGQSTELAWLEPVQYFAPTSDPGAFRLQITKEQAGIIVTVAAAEAAADRFALSADSPFLKATLEVRARWPVDREPLAETTLPAGPVSIAAVSERTDATVESGGGWLVAVNMPGQGLVLLVVRVTCN